MATTPLPRFARSRLEEALDDTPVVLIHGPRQCGKTTLARMVGERRGYTYLSFDDGVVLAAAESDPAGFVADLPSKAILDEVQRRTVEEGLSEEELALFDLLLREKIGVADRERLKQASRDLLASLQEVLRPIHDWAGNSATQAEVKVFILDTLWQSLPRPPFTDADTEAAAERVYEFVWQRSMSGGDRHAA